MTASELHELAMELADKADAAGRSRRGSADLPGLYREALDAESRAVAAYLASPDADQEPGRSILLRSAAALARLAGDSRQATRFLCMALAGRPPAPLDEEIQTELLHHLQGIYQADDRIAGGQGFARQVHDSAPDTSGLHAHLLGFERAQTAVSPQAANSWQLVRLIQDHFHRGQRQTPATRLESSLMWCYVSALDARRAGALDFVRESSSPVQQPAFVARQLASRNFMEHFHVASYKFIDLIDDRSQVSTPGTLSKVWSAALAAEAVARGNSPQAELLIPESTEQFMEEIRRMLRDHTNDYAASQGPQDYLLRILGTRRLGRKLFVPAPDWHEHHRVIRGRLWTGTADSLVAIVDLEAPKATLVAVDLGISHKVSKFSGLAVTAHVQPNAQGLATIVDLNELDAELATR